MLKLNPIILFIMFCLASFLLYNKVNIINEFVFFNNNFLLLKAGGVYFPYINVLFFVLILILGTIIGLYAIPYFGKEIHHKAIGLNRIKQYNIFINLFIFSMLIVSITSNIMIMWIAIEATTIFTTFLISFYNTKTTREAARKYAVLCGIGLTIGLFGIFLLIYGGLENLTFFAITSATINPLLIKLGFALVFVGIGTKVTFFPTQTRLPDAHGKASTPVSAFMSSILLPLALYTIFRLKIITDQLLGTSHFTNIFFIIFGLLTVFYASVVLLKQNHLKRALAYSSSENMGIMAIAIGLATPFSMIFFVMHLLAHGFFKTASFMGAGNILLHTNTGQFHKIKNITKSMKVTPILLIISLFLLLGVPISPIFLTETGITMELLKGHGVFAVIFVVAMILVFSGIVNNFSRLFYDKVYDKDDQNIVIIEKEPKLTSIHIPIILSILLGVLSVFVLFFIK